MKKEELNMKKKLLTFTIIFSMLCSMNITAKATTNSMAIGYDLNQVKQCIDNFFYAYEGVENSNNTLDSTNSASDSIGIIKEMASNENRTIYEKASKSKQASEAKSYLNTVEYMLQRKEFIEKNLDIDEKEYNKKLDIELKDISESKNCLQVSVEVSKTWNYSFSKDIESAARDTYKVSLIIENGEYVIQNIKGFGASIFDEELKANNDNISQYTKKQMLRELQADFTAEAEQHTEEIAAKQQSTKEKTAKANNYDGEVASRYALNHANSKDYNKNYADFNDYGGDCTNFISQCLKAGGIKQHVGTAYSGNCWFYKTSTNRSSTWTGADKFRKYVTGNSSKINMPGSSWGSVTFGDIIQLMSGSSAYHSLIVSGVAYGSSGRSDLLVCCHSADRRHVSLSSNFSGTKKYYHVKGNK